MTYHHARAVRLAVVSQLTGLTTTADRVRPTVLQKVARSDMPCLRIVTGDETRRAGSKTTAVRRTQQVAVMGYVHSTSDEVQDALDRVLAEVEAALEADRSLGGACLSAEVSEIQRDFQEDDGVIGILRIALDVNYGTKFGSPHLPN